MVIALLGTLDTKGQEYAFVAERIRERGHATLLIDVGSLDPPLIEPDIRREEVAQAGGLDWPAIVARRDRGAAVEAMSQAAPMLLCKLVAEGRLDGVLALGGSGGTAIATTAMRALPIGLPKLMVSTLASGDVAGYVGVKDILMMPSIVDVSGINRVSRLVLTRAAGAICGMVESKPCAVADKPLIVASMFGNTTECVNVAKDTLEAAGYEVLVFHATGAGGRAMESLIESGLVSGVLDVTTTEWADELVGGVLSAGPTRLEAAARRGVPAVLAPGCLDMVNFRERASVPQRFADRLFYQHNPQVTLMRTTAQECAELGRILAEKANLSVGPVSVMVPTKAISVISAPGQAFHDPVADAALFRAIKDNLRADIPLREFHWGINDREFATACALELLRLIEFQAEASQPPVVASLADFA